ncbi:hypothetical protein C8F01DRAFT_1168952, partial [Mycena amicta]
MKHFRIASAQIQPCDSPCDIVCTWRCSPMSLPPTPHTPRKLKAIDDGAIVVYTDDEDNEEVFQLLSRLRVSEESEPMAPHPPAVPHQTRPRQPTRPTSPPPPPPPSAASSSSASTSTPSRLYRYQSSAVPPSLTTHWHQAAALTQGAARRSSTRPGSATQEASQSHCIRHNPRGSRLGCGILGSDPTAQSSTPVAIDSRCTPDFRVARLLKLPSTSVSRPAGLVPCRLSAPCQFLCILFPSLSKTSMIYKVMSLALPETGGTSFLSGSILGLPIKRGITLERAWGQELLARLVAHVPRGTTRIRGCFSGRSLCGAQTLRCS